jgi:sialic acid synthase SpsE
VSFPTYILDLANNHGGSVDNGLDIIRAHAAVVNGLGVDAAIKLQIRDLDRYDHGDQLYCMKFDDCRLSESDISTLIKEIRSQGLQVAITAFDPPSADYLALADIAKVASCSRDDRETIEAILKADLPTIFSTGGTTIDEAGNLAECYWERIDEFALMHCISIYPTPYEKLNLPRIEILRHEVPMDVTIGFSSHEDGIASLSLAMAKAYGAAIYERHIGLDHCNAYSVTPDELEMEIETWEGACLSVSNIEEQRQALARVERKRAA